MIPRFLRALRACATLAVALATLASAGPAGAVAPPQATAQAALALDCNRLTAADQPLVEALPAPRIIALQGSVPIVTMEPFAQFLIGMGYPEAALRDPEDGALSQSSFQSSETLAGEIAAYYEQSGLRPMLIGHSQGGMLVVRTLHELAGGFSDALPVVDPATGAVEHRTTIVDPYTGRERPVVGVRVSFAAAIATGALPRLLLGQWSMLSRLRKIPDSTLEFTGFAIAYDPIAGNLGTAEPYVATGSAAVRNVMLPATYSHIGAPITEHLAEQPATRAWIDAWSPDAAPPLPAAAVDTRNLLHAADLWHSVRRHWCAEGQRRVRATGGAT
jgi:pimeloyl-ACP methyl ester carboxylesterase